MIKNIHIRIALSAAIALFFSACAKDLPSQAHESGSATINTSSQVENSASMLVIADENNSGGKIDAAQAKSAIKEMQNSFFKESILLSPLNNGDEKKRNLEKYNNALLQLKTINHSSLPEYLAEYERLVSLGCSGQQISGCRLVQVFQSAANSYEVWQLVLSQKTNDRVLIRQRAWLAWKLLNARPDGGIKAAVYFLQEADGLEKFVAESKDKELEQEYWTTISRIIATGAKLQGEPAYENFVKKMLDAEIRFRSGSAREKIIEELVQAESARGLFKREWFLSILKKYYGKNSNGLNSAENLLQSKSPNTLSAYGINSSLERSVQFYLIENVYLDVWNAGAAYQLWHRSNPSSTDQELLHANIKTYAKTQILATVAQSNQIMADFFRNRKNYNSSQIHIEAYRASQTIHSNWLKLYTSIARLRNFSLMIYGTGSAKMLSLQLDQEHLNEASLYLVSFPHMMVLAYEMAKQKFKIGNWFASIDHTAVIQMLFSGNLGESFFDYTQGESSRNVFDPTRILYSFHFALKSQTFEAFDIQPQDFTELVLREMSKASTSSASRYDQSFKVLSRYWTDPYETMAAEFAEFEQFCKVERERDSKNSGSNSPAYNLSVSLTDLDMGIIRLTKMGRALYDNTFHSRFMAKNPYTRTGISMISHEHEQGLELIRTEAGFVFNFISDFYAIYRQHLSNTYGSIEKVPPAIAEKLSVTDKILELSRHNSRRFYTEVYNYVDNFLLPCANIVARRELELQNSVILYEFEWLKQLYRDYQALKKNPNNAEILARYKVVSKEKPDFAGYDRFDLENNTFLGHKIDAFFRFKKYLGQGLKTASIDLPALNRGINVVVPADGFKDIEFVSRPQPFQLSFTDIQTEDEFAKKYIRLMRSPDSSAGRYRSFASFHYDAGSMLTYFMPSELSIISALLKAGTVETYPSDKKHCLSEEPAKGCEIVQRGLTDTDVNKILLEVLALVTRIPGDEKIFEVLGITERGLRLALNSTGGGVFIYAPGSSILFYPQTLRPMGFYDHYYALTTNLVLGFAKSAPWDMPKEGGVGNISAIVGFSPLERASQLYRARLGDQYLIFPPADSVKNYLFSKTKERVLFEFSVPKRIEKLAEKLKAEDLSKGFTREYPMLTGSGNSVSGYYLDPVLVGNQNAREWEFHKSTGHIFSE